MRRTQKRRRCLLPCALILALLLAGCSGAPAEETEQAATATDAALVQLDAAPVSGEGEALSPGEWVDLSGAYTETTVSGDSQEVQTLLCEYLPEEEAALSAESLTVGADTDCVLSFVATWAASGETLYLGVVDTAQTCAYTVALNGGTAAGELSLADLPEGAYQVIAYTTNNPNVLACVSYWITGQAA